jgi:hypothetical protein
MTFLAIDLASDGRSLARLDAQAEGDVLEHRHVAEQRVVLEHEADVALAHVHVRWRPRRRTARARVGRSRPAMMRSSVVLPQPEGPSSATSSPEGCRGRRRRAREIAEALADVADFDAHDCSSNLRSGARMRAFSACSTRS